MNFLCKYNGGSHSYGLNTPSSDLDVRGVYNHVLRSYILGLNRFDHLVTQNEKEDSCFYELRNFFGLLRKGNSQCLEMLFNQNWLEVSSEFINIQKHRNSLIDIDKTFKCLEGYSVSELKLALGMRTGKLGGKRKSNVDKFGFSPKNFVQLIRLNYCGAVLFEKGYFPVNILKDNQELGNFLIDVKTNPQKYTKEQLTETAQWYVFKMCESYKNRSFNYRFYEDVANDLIFRVYKKYLN